MKEISEASRQILYLLKKSEAGMTIDALCKSLNVTPMAVHRPLAALVDQDLVASELLRQAKRGRPLRVFKLTDNAEEYFPKNYGRLLMEFLEDLGAREGSARIRKFFETRFRRSANSNREKMKGKDLGGRVHALCQILNQNDYMVESEQLGHNKFVIRLLNCPISKVAREYPQACSCEKQYLSDLLQAKVERDHHILKGQTYCSYIIRK
ncbi:HTH domain-containing protein [bacterium]|nr:HTH domain-containing protein [bacterium]MCI0603492.1 HTH domain-containing protein [bacterium]